MGELSEQLKRVVDVINDDAVFMEEEYDTVHNYCRERKYRLEDSDMETIKARGLEDNYATWKQAYVEELWMKFGDVPMNPETECIEEPWEDFLAGTHREEIWHWFEETYDVSVAEDLMGL